MDLLFMRLQYRLQAAFSHHRSNKSPGCSALSVQHACLQRPAAVPKEESAKDGTLL